MENTFLMNHSLIPQFFSFQNCTKTSEGSNVCLEKELSHCVKILKLTMKHMAPASWAACSQQLS